MRWIALLLVVLTGCASAPAPRHLVMPTVAVPDSMFAEASARACFDRLQSLAGHGRFEHERAAFLVLDHTNRFDCVVWPATMRHHSEQWRGAVPHGTAAIAHTHPRGLPHPSAADEATAEQLGIPVFVVTPRGVTAANLNTSSQR